MLEAEDAGRALVAVAALHEAGWGSPQLAAELVDELRQTFLAALAPELGDAGGDQQTLLADRAGRLGLPRLVRSIEVLGRIQVDMRDAPQTRGSSLRSPSSGSPDRSSTTPPLVWRTGWPGSSGPSPAASPPPANRPPAPAPPLARPRPAPPPPLDPAAPPAAAPAPTTPAPVPQDAGDPSTRPGLGALRRQRAAQDTPPAAAPVDASPRRRRRPAASAPAPPAPAASAEPPRPPPSSPAPPTPAPAPPTVDAAPTGGPVDRDVLVQAWGDHILRTLPARAKALYSAGRFVSAEGSTAVFALPNAAHCDRCEDVRSVVEDAIAGPPREPGHADPRRRRLGGRGHRRHRRAVAPPPPPPPVPPLGSTAAARPGPVGTARTASAARADSTTQETDEEVFDPDDVVDAVPVESVAEARVLEAFPGAEEV